MSLNRVTLIGHIGRDFNLVEFTNGSCIAQTSLATTEKWLDKSTGETVSKTDWHQIVIKNNYGRTAKNILRKGDKVYIEGALKYRKWVDQNNNERISAEIIVSNFELINSKNQATDNNDFNNSYPEDYPPCDNDLDNYNV